jgi:hypothetical protein
VCVENNDGCLLCKGKLDEAPFLEAAESRPEICAPQDPDDCVEFCSAVTAACALPWTKGPTCLLGTELEWMRAVFHQEAADRPQVTFVGRVTDESGRVRIEGARVRVWVSREAASLHLLDTVAEKDGMFRLPLRTGPWTYTLRLSHAGRASEIVERLQPDARPERGTPPGPAAARTFRLGPEQVIRGRVVDGATGEPVADALVSAFRSSEDAYEIAGARTAADGGFTLRGLAERQRYELRASKFGWRPETFAQGPLGRPGAPNRNEPIAAPAQRVVLRLVRTGVIRGVVVDADDVAEPDATVLAVLAGAPGPSVPVTWNADEEGRFEQADFVAGTYYLWARRGQMFVYPPVKKELGDGQDAEVRLQLHHKGARVIGRVRGRDGEPWAGRGVAKLVGGSPLAFPRAAVADIDREGRFVLTGVLPGRYEVRILSGTRGELGIVRGPRDVEIPIEPGSVVQLKEPVVVRPPINE